MVKVQQITKSRPWYNDSVSKKSVLTYLCLTVKSTTNMSAVTLTQTYIYRKGKHNLTTGYSELKTLTPGPAVLLGASVTK